MGRKIMIVEDSPTLAEMVRDELEDAGYEPLLAHNGFEALRDLDTFKPDLIVTDIMMPKVDGLELCAAIHNRLETRDIPFILFSSKFDDDTVKRGRAIGARFFLAKPFKMTDLIACVQKVLG
jgi:DNA-binding response OmpR family regulator